MEQNSIEQLIYQETEERLNEMQSDSYEFPKQITRVDVVCMIVGAAVSVVMIVLCMLGVIK